MEFMTELSVRALDNAQNHLLAIANPKNRLFALYLLSSVIMAFMVYLKTKDKPHSAANNLLQFLFPKKVWSHPSAWLDLRYFVFHSLVGKFLLVGLALWSTAFGFRLASGGLSLFETVWRGGWGSGSDIFIAFGFMFVAMFVSDFLGWFCHYLQHKSPLLWQFHKVHHSAEVMHPVSNFREHPVDNFTYMVVIGAGNGLLLGLTTQMLDFTQSFPTVFGVPVLMLLFNLVGYNLRHSHVWLRWPGRLSMIFPSPAHHHVHHSSHPDHLDKNFAFMFPIWDVIFKTYHMPDDDRDVKFGIGEGNAEELDSCLRLYWVPVRDACRVLKAQVKGVDFNMSKPAAVTGDRGRERKMHPAE